MFLSVRTISRFVLPSCVCVKNTYEKFVMGNLNHVTSRLATLLVLQAAGAGLASPTVLITQPYTRVAEWLPTDNQTLYRLGEGERRSLELNTSTITQAMVFITISPCTKDFHWALYYGKAGNSNGHLTLKNEKAGGQIATLSLSISYHDKYVLQLSSVRGGSAVVSVRGEPTSQVKLRLRVRSRRRLAANWDPSPIDPQDTTYYVVASHLRNYTSLCAAQHDLKISRYEKLNRMIEERRLSSERSVEVDNTIDTDDGYSLFEGNLRKVFRRKKIGRSTKVTDEDPVIACVGDRTHHLIENLDPSKTYMVSVFAVGRDRRWGSLLGAGRVRARTSAARSLRENIAQRQDVRGRTVYYFKASVGTSGGAWFSLTSCGGAVDVEVLAKGKRIYADKNIDPHSKFFVPAPRSTSSAQEISDEGSVQFDSSSEETKTRFVIKIVPSMRDRSSSTSVEITASTTRWGISAPELLGDGATVRELRQRRSCRSTFVAFLPATHNATDVIRYCVSAREMTTTDHFACASSKKAAARTHCTNHIQLPSKVIVQKIFGLKAGRKYAIQVVASNRGSSVPYNVLYVDTNASCKDDPQ